MDRALFLVTKAYNLSSYDLRLAAEHYDVGADAFESEGNLEAATAARECAAQCLETLYRECLAA